MVAVSSGISVFMSALDNLQIHLRLDSCLKRVYSTVFDSSRLVILIVGLHL